MAFAGLNESQVRLNTSLECAPHTATTQQLFTVGVVVVGLKRQAGDHRLECMKARMLMNITKRL